MGSANPIRAGYAWTGVLCLLGMVACSDGYPTEDVPQIEPAHMTQSQVLAALNELGQKARHDKRWRYTLRDGCELEITQRDGGRQRHRVALEGAAIATRSADGIIVIRIERETNKAQAVTALETRRWPDLIRARDLLTQLVFRCGSPVPSAP